MKEFFKNVYNEYIRFPLYIVFHPFDGFDELKREKRGKVSVAVTFIILFGIIRIIQIQYTGFIIFDRNPSQMNSLKEIFSTILLVALFVIGNWSVTTLMEGKGSAKEIFITTGYALAPLLYISVFSIVLSNLVTLEEVGIYNLILLLGYIFFGWTLFMGMLNIHEYGLFKTIAAFLATAVSMAVMIFVGLLFFDLIQQLVTFVKMILEELSLRY